MTRAAVVYTIFGVLHFVGVFLLPQAGVDPWVRTWGFHHLSYLSLPTVLIAYMLFTVSLTQPFQNRIVHGITKPVIAKDGAFCLIVTLLLAVALGLLRQKYPFLGDGHVRSSELDNELVHSNGKAYIWLIMFVSRTFDLTGVESFAIVSLFFGIPFIYLSLMIGRDISKDRLSRVSVSVLLVSSGILQLYAGYVEVYPPLPVLILLFVWLGLKAKNSPLHRHAAILLGLGGLMIHPLGSITILPALFLMWRYDVQHRPGTIRFIFLGVLGAGVVVALTEGAIEKIVSVLLPVLPTDDKPYGMITFQNLSERLNGVILAAPALLPILILTGFRVIDTGRLYVLILAGSGLAGLFAFDFVLGSLDWDLMSLMSFPLTIMVALAIPVLPKQTRSSIAIPACVIGLLNTVPWIWINATDASIRRLEDITMGEQTSYFESHNTAVRVALAFRKEEMPQEAISVLKRAAQKDPTNLDLQYNLAAIASENYDFETTIPAARAVLRREPWHLEAYKLLRGGLIKLQKKDEIDTLLAQHSENLIRRGQQAFKNGALSKAGLTYSSAAFMDLQNPGTLIRSEGAEKLLVAAFRELTHHNLPVTFDRLPEQMRSLARRAYRTGDREAAVRYWNAGMRMGLRDESIHQNHGVALIELGRVVEGLNSWRKGIEKNPKSTELRHILGVTLAENGIHEEASRLLKEAINLEPTETRHYLQYGALLVAQNRHREAIGLYKDGLKKIPNDPDLQQSLKTLR